jgi:class 3 adenylate cyclase
MPSFVFAGLTRQQELDAIETALELGAPLHLVLPAPGPQLIDRWQRQHGSEVASRLTDCLRRTQEISVAHGFLEDEDGWCAQYVAAMACGLSKLMSRHLGCGWLTAESALEDENREARLCEWQATPASVHGRYSRQQIGTLFADFVGFSRLSDDVLPAFWSYFTSIITAINQRHGGRILYHRTWGDALHIVAVDAAAIADIAVDLRDTLERMRPALEPALSRLEWRLAAHYAPVFRDHEAGGAPIFFGSPLSFAARVEPITPPGMIFVTEAFAARLALEAPLDYAAEYVGELDLPKAYGKYRLFNLRRMPPVTL